MKSKGFMEKQDNVIVKIVKPDSLAWQKCVEFEYKIFLDCGYIEPNREKRVLEYDKYTENGEILAAYVGKTNDLNSGGGGGDIAGVFRVIYAPYEHKMKKGLFPTFDKAKELNIYPEKLKMLKMMDPRTIGDIGTMAIDPTYRDSRVSKALSTRVNTRGYEKKHIRYALAAIDTPFYNKLKERGYPFHDLGPSSMYMGSYSTATIIDSYSNPKGIQKVGLGYYICKGKIRRLIFNKD